MSSGCPCKHLAVIMDGNGRWAESKNHKRFYGHVKGAKRARELVEICSQLKLPYLSLFALSTENFLSRPETEISALQKLLQRIFLKYSDFLLKNQIRLNFIGDLSVFSPQLKKLCHDLSEKTKRNQGLNLILALNYGGRQEILQAFKKLAKEVKENSLKPENLNETRISSFFSSSQFPEPDLIIRTGGEVRLSNFYLWSASYSELYFTRVLWPDFKRKDLSQAFEHFRKVKRRYGKL